MKKLILGFIFVFSFIYSNELGSVLNELDSMYNYRHKSKYTLWNMLKIIDSFLVKYPFDASLLTRKATVYLKIGDAKTKKSEKLFFYSKSKKVAKECIEKHPKCADCFFWYGASMGRIGQTKGVLKSLSLVGPIKKAFLKAISIDSKHYMSLAALGVLYYELPGFAGGDINKSIKYIKEAIAVKPNYTLAWVNLGTAYFKKGKKQKAKAALKYVISCRNPLIPSDYFLNDLKQAKKLLKRVEK